MKLKSFLEIVGSILVCQTAGFIGAFFTASNVPTWYTTIKKPVFNPPNWIFGPVWITLYCLMGIALYLIWVKRGEHPQANFGVYLFLAHLVLNALWSVIFFGMHKICWAFVEIIILWAMILVLMLLFSKIDKRATYLLIPYFLWVSFASVLNYSICMLNK